MLYFWSDPHFSHKNVIQYCNRPFENISEMNNKLIENFRNKVPVNEDNEVFILGDIWDPEPLCNLADYNMSLILGNHDRNCKALNRIKDCINKYHLNLTIYRYPIIIQHYIILSHEPIEGLNRNSFFLNICGHVHNSIILNDKSWYSGNRYWNACVEMNDYAPVSLDEIIEKMEIEHE